MSQAKTVEQSRVQEFLENPKRALWKLSLPILGGMAIHTLYSVVDMIFVGWVGPDAVAALAFNMPLVFMAYGMTMGLSTGVTAVVAQAIGARDKTRADNTAEHAVFLGLTIGIGVSIIGLFWGSQMLVMLGAEGEVSHLAWSYFQVICYGLTFSVLSAFFRGILAGEGDTIRPMTIMGAGMILNIILDPVFIFWMDMGVRGAAMATMVSQVVSFLIFIYVIFQHKSTYVQFQLQHFRFQPHILSSIFRIGLPASLSFIFMSIGQAGYNKILSHFSHYAVAAYQIASRVEMIYFMPVIAIAAGLVTLVGMFYGAGAYRRMRGIIRYALLWCTGFGILAAVLIYPMAPIVMAAFGANEEILNYGVGYLRVIVFIFPFAPIGMISGRVMQGFGKGMPFMVLSFIRVVAVGVPMAAILTYLYNQSVVWVWLSMIAGAVAAMTIGLIWLRASLTTAEALPATPDTPDAPKKPALEGTA